MGLFLFLLLLPLLASLPTFFRCFLKSKICDMNIWELGFGSLLPCAECALSILAELSVGSRFGLGWKVEFYFDKVRMEWIWVSLLLRWTEPSVPGVGSVNQLPCFWSGLMSLNLCNWVWGPVDELKLRLDTGLLIFLLFKILRLLHIIKLILLIDFRILIDNSSDMW